MLVPLCYVVIGIALLLWSAGLFVSGAAATARHLGVPPLIVGMVIIGFGTSAPEIVVSVLAASQGNPGLAFGNAFGSNIANIALILGLTALISPIAVSSSVLRKELPVLSIITLVTCALFWDSYVSRTDSIMMLGMFAAVMTWMIWQGLSKPEDTLGDDVLEKLQAKPISKWRAAVYLVLGLIFLISSSRLLVTGAVELAKMFGVSDLIIGLTIVAIGTSLPELASSLVAAKRGEHDLALGNVIGSNFFNTLAVAGLAGAIHPTTVDPLLFSRDLLVMSGLTFSLFVLGAGSRGPGRINRFDGGLLLTVFVVYTGVLIYTAQ